MSRLFKVASLLKKEISAILLTRINNNKIGFITILSVDVSKDFSVAKVFYSQIGSDQEIQETKKALSSASKFIYFELCILKITILKITTLYIIYEQTF